MSDWEFLHEMRDRGYSPDEIADAAGSGAAPWEWEALSREWIDKQLDEAPEEARWRPASIRQKGGREGFPYSTLQQFEIFEDLVNCASRHLENTGRYLQLWGELGEIYAEVKFGLCRHATHRAGSDGTISGRLVEVKTISPEKTSDEVRVRKQGDFEQLLIVRIDPDFTFAGKMFDRSELKGGVGKFLRARFSDNGSNR